MLLNDFLTDPTQQPQLTSSGGTSSATPTLQKPKAPTGTTGTNDPTAPVAALPLAGSPSAPAPAPAPAAPMPAPTSPPPLTTSDPLAFAPSPSAPAAPYVAPTGQQFVPGTQTTDPTTGAVTQSGVLGLQNVPGSNGGLVDLGGGNFAPMPGSDPTQGYMFGGQRSILTAGGAAPTQDMNLQSGLYGSSAYNPGNLFQAVYRGPAGDLIFAAPGFDPAQLPTGATLLSGNAPFQGAPSAANGGTSSGAAPSSGMRSIAPGAANDAGTPSSLPPGSPGSVTLSPGGASAPPPAGGTPGNPNQIAPGVAGYQTTPENALTNQTILPSNTIDRYKLANDALTNTIQNVLDPEFEANLRDANRYSFGAGRGVSGIARTREGNVVSDYNRQKANLTNTLLNTATTGSIDDLYRNVGLALQEQGFQAGQQNTAFNQNLALQGLSDQEQQSAFSRALQQLMQGSSGNPADVALVLSQIFGSQAGAAGSAASNYVASQQQQQNQQQQQQTFQDWLNQLLMNQIPSASSLPIQTTPGGGY